MSIKHLWIIGAVLLAGCQGVPEGRDCSFWNNVPYDASQTPWREFDCPFTGHPNRK